MRCVRDAGPCVCAEGAALASLPKCPGLQARLLTFRSLTFALLMYTVNCQTVLLRVLSVLELTTGMSRMHMRFISRMIGTAANPFRKSRINPAH